MKNINKFLTITIFMLVISCSSDFLEFQPKGVISSNQLDTPEKVDQLVTAVYSAMGNEQWPWEAPWDHMWMFGSLRSEDTYKGGDSTGDAYNIHILEIFSPMTTDLENANYVWTSLYGAVERSNEALRRMAELTENEYPNLKTRQAECRFLRGYFNFTLKILFKYPVFLDETIPPDQFDKVSNRLYTNDELWDKIAADFQYAVDNLPLAQEEIGRANKYAAMAFLAKTRLYQAYEQDEQHNVVNINTSKLQEVVNLTDKIIGNYQLNDDFAKNFLHDYENGPESIFAIQYSLNDGTPEGRHKLATGLNYSMAAEYGCCNFGRPSQTLVNTFKTDVNGLPMFDTFNDSEMKDPADFFTNGVDPRLDHTVGIRTHPFKYDPEFIVDDSWSQVPALYGYYVPMKEIAHPESSGFLISDFRNATNVDILRYDDVLLMKAEALIELGRHVEAMPLINEIRERAKNSTGRLKHSDGSYASNYRIESYSEGNVNWTQDFARQALRMERRLEFAQEGSRFFDLVRWGIAAESLNSYFEIETQRTPHLQGAFFTKGRDEYLPIPQSQITVTSGLYEQNNGW